MGGYGYPDTVGSKVVEALERLYRCVGSGELAELCRRNGAELLVVFGGAARGDSEPSDLDIAVRFHPRAVRDVLTLIADLYDITRLEAIDLLVLNDAGPLARERAMVGGRLLYQAKPGTFATEQIAAIMERLDTDYLRRLELELMTR